MRWKYVPVSRPASASAARLAEVRTTGTAGGGGDAGGLDLGDHAAGAHARFPGAADGDARQVLGAGDLGDPGGAGGAGRSVVEAVDVGEEDQQVGVDEVGDEGGEPVVVAEADLVGGDGVVLVDDGDGAHLQELVQGAVGVAVVTAAAGVVGGEEHLADADAVAREGGGVAGHEEALSDAGGGLLAGQVLGPHGRGRAGRVRRRWLHWRRGRPRVRRRP